MGSLDGNKAGKGGKTRHMELLAGKLVRPGDQPPPYCFDRSSGLPHETFLIARVPKFAWFASILTKASAEVHGMSSRWLGGMLLLI